MGEILRRVADAIGWKEKGVGMKVAALLLLCCLTIVAQEPKPRRVVDDDVGRAVRSAGDSLMKALDEIEKLLDVIERQRRALEQAKAEAASLRLKMEAVCVAECREVRNWSDCKDGEVFASAGKPRLIKCCKLSR